MTEQLAQVPDAATLQAAKGYVDPLLQLGAVGVICLVLILAAFFLARALIACMNTSRESAAANATVIANNTAKAEAAARELDALKDEFRSLKEQIMWRQNAAPHP